MKKVLVINDSSLPLGGASSLALLSAKLYHSLGYEVTFFTGQCEPKELSEIGIKTVSLGSDRLLESPRLIAAFRGFHNAEAQRRLAEWIAQNDDADTVYHLNNWAQVLSPSIFVPLREVSDRTIITCHDFFSLCPNGSFTHFKRSEPCSHKPLSVQCAMSQCDRRNSVHKYWRYMRQVRLNSVANLKDGSYTFACIHSKVRERLVQDGFTDTNCVVVPNTVRPWSDTRIEAERNKAFLFVGRIGRDKGADIALTATANAREALHLIGTGELVEGGAHDYPHAKFLGWKDREDMLDAVKDARCLIVPSRVTEPFGLVILEAAMSGIPVIVSDRAYLANEIEREGFGRKFDINSVSGLETLLAEFSSDDELIEKMSHACFENSHALCLSGEDWIKEYVSIFEQKLNAN